MTDEPAADDRPDLTALYVHAMPDDQPGAWIREAIRAKAEAGEATFVELDD